MYPDIDGRASRGCPEICQGNCERKTRFRTQVSDKVHGAALNTQGVISVVHEVFRHNCPEALEENRREMNEPRRHPERDNHQVVELRNLHTESQF